MFLPRILRPLPDEPLTDERVQRTGQVPFSVLTGPVGAYITERLAGTIMSWDRWHGCVWLRNGALRPAPLARELADACRHHWGTDGAHPDPAGPNVMASLRGLLARAPAEPVVVVEIDARGVRSVRQLVTDLRPALVERRATVLVVAEARWRRWTAAGAVPLDVREAGAGLLPPPCRDNLLRLARRRPAILHDVAAAAQTWGVDTVSAVVGGAENLRDLLADVTGRLVDRCDAGELAALRTCVDTGYWHPRLTAPAATAPRLRPWMVPLEEGWCWLRPVWKEPLRRQLGARRSRSDVSVRPAVLVDPGPRAQPAARAVLQAKLFGEIEVRVDGRVVTRWHGKRGCSLLRFLLARPQRGCSRDELLATFWPEVAPQVARNRLQVAVSGLRRAFTEVTNVNVVEYTAGSYRISEALRVEVDVDRFEAAVAAGKRAERADDGAGTVTAYRQAVDCYRGDFAADVPSEPWTLVVRENLRIAYLDALASIGRVELARGAHDDCIAAARQMLEADPCREDAHRLLMRCYTRQGRTYEAHRQYEFCRRVLRSALDVEPAAETTRLYHAIRAGSVAEPALIGRRGRTR